MNGNVSALRDVSALRAIAITHRLLVRQLVTKGRIAALLGVGIIVSIVVGLVAQTVSDNQSAAETLKNSVEVMAVLGFTGVVPIVALVFAAAAFGDLVEDNTLVYLWLRPMGRWPIVVGAWLGSVTVSLPISTIPLAVSAAITNVGSSLIWGTLLASVVGTLVYSAVFLLLGLLLRNAVVWGIAYILIWEGFIAGVSSVGAKLAIRGYTRSILSEQTGVGLSLAEVSLTVSLLVSMLVVIVALLLSTLRLRSLDVA